MFLVPMDFNGNDSDLWTLTQALACICMVIWLIFLIVNRPRS